MANPITPQRLYAWFFIGFHGMKGFVLRALSAEKSGLTAFKDNYVGEGLPPISPAAREDYDRFVRCTGCGSCDVVCPLTRTSNPLEWRGPMAVAVSMSRAAPHYEECRPALAYFDQCGNCRACEAVCPEGIPIKTVAQVMRASIEEIEAGRQRKG